MSNTIVPLFYEIKGDGHVFCEKVDVVWIAIFPVQVEVFSFFADSF